MSTIKLKQLCQPSQLYLFISMIALIVVVYYNYEALDFTLCIGEYRCFSILSKTDLLILNSLYIFFWTFILDLLCKSGYKNLAWFLVLLPVLLFIIFLLFVFGPWRHNKSIFESMENQINNEDNQEGERKVYDYDEDSEEIIDSDDTIKNN